MMDNIIHHSFLFDERMVYNEYMTTINTPEDLLRLVRENEAFRDAMRRELLTAEILEAPENVAALLEHARSTNARLDKMDQTIAAIIEQTNAINRRLDRMDNRLDSMDNRLDSMEGRLDSMDNRLDSMEGRLDNIEGDVSVIKRDIDGLGDAFRREVKAQSSFRGNYAQRATIMSNQDIASRFAHLHGLRRVKTRQVRRSTSESWLSNNIPLVESLGLRERAWNTFLVPDDIAGVIPLEADNDTTPAYYIVVESSYTIDEEDVLKATDHAQIVRAVTGIEAYAVVAGAEVDDEMGEETRRRLYVGIERFVEANDPNAAYCYLLDSADMRPPEPY